MINEQQFTRNAFRDACAIRAMGAFLMLRADQNTAYRAKDHELARDAFDIADHMAEARDKANALEAEWRKEEKEEKESQKIAAALKKAQHEGIQAT